MAGRRPRYWHCLLLPPDFVPPPSFPPPRGKKVWTDLCDTAAASVISYTGPPTSM